jgi:Ca2+-transporting ATPase
MEGTPGSSAWKDGAVPTGKFCSLLASDLRDIMVKSIAINSTAFEGEEDGMRAYIGSKTEAALLTFARDWLGMQPLHEERANAEVVEVYPFNSTRKCMAVVTQLPYGSHRIYLKGAPEIVLEKSSRVISKTTSQLSEHVHLTKDRLDVLTGAINEYTSQSLRALGFAYRDLPSWPPPGDEVGEDIFADMTFLGVLGLQDPLRPGVEAAVALCQHAGVFVRMVTGDNVRTAQAVARKCGILTESGVIMEGPDFRKLSIPEMDSILPHLQMLARSSPEDKRMLVKRLKEIGETVAVTGDGSNDGPALRAADVGFSMGISGTEVAKDASSIILMDDNFSSIVKAIEWGRTVNDVIKKFLHVCLHIKEWSESRLTSITVSTYG